MGDLFGTELDQINKICVNLIDGSPNEEFLALGFGVRFRKICENTTLRLLGILPKLIPEKVWEALVQS